jgi:hypothetical protein
MKKKLTLYKFSTLGFSAIVLSTLAFCVQANLVTNGSFEATSHTVTVSTLLGPPGLAVGWSNIGAGGDFLIVSGSGLAPFAGITNSGTPLYPTYGLRGPFPVAAPDGNNYVLSDGNFHNAPIKQSISGLTIGSFYQLSFYQALAQIDESLFPTGSAVTGHWQVSFGTDILNSLAMSANGATPNPSISPWSLQTMTFKANATTEVLSFLSVGTGLPPMVSLDGVSLTAVPEPALSWLLFSGLMGLIALGRRHQIAKA